MFQAQNRETTHITWKVAVSFKIIMTTSMTRPCFTTQHQTCKTKTKTDFLVSDRSCPKTYGLRPHHWYTWRSRKQFNATAAANQNRNSHASVWAAKQFFTNAHVLLLECYNSVVRDFYFPYCFLLIFSFISDFPRPSKTQFSSPPWHLYNNRMCFEMLQTAVQHDTGGIYYSTATVKNAHTPIP